MIILSILAAIYLSLGLSIAVFTKPQLHKTRILLYTVTGVLVPVRLIYMFMAETVLCWGFWIITDRISSK